jgi:hypothetical protein
VRRVEVRLYGSLAATGIGHGTDRAVVLGLMGERPDRVDPDRVGPSIAEARRSGTLMLAGREPVPFHWTLTCFHNRLVSGGTSRIRQCWRFQYSSCAAVS